MPDRINDVTNITLSQSELYVYYYKLTPNQDKSLKS